VLLVALALALIGRVVAEDETPSVTITTPPYKVQQEIFIDLDDSGLHEADEFVGIFDVYNWNEPLSFTWEAGPHEQVDPETASYRIALRQYPLGDANLVGWAVDHRVSHHWASSGRAFTYGVFGGDLCLGCITFIVVEPEIVSQVWDEGSQSYVYQYTPYVDPGNPEQSLAQFSKPFVYEGVAREPDSSDVIPCSDRSVGIGHYISGDTFPVCVCAADPSQYFDVTTCPSPGWMWIPNGGLCGCKDPMDWP
jgi:hypothetical protein